MNNVKVDKIQAQNVIETALIAKEERRGLFENFYAPEEKFVELTKVHEELSGKDGYALNALFLITTMVFSTRTDQFFGRLCDQEMFDKHSWLFEPKEVVSHTPEEVMLAVAEYTRPSSYQNNALKQWFHNCQILVDKYDGDVRNFFLENNNDAIEIIDSLVVKPRKKGKTGIRRYGPKLSILLMQWVSQYELYDLENVHDIGAPIDIQLARIAIQTGIVKFDSHIEAHYLTFAILLPLVKDLVKKNDWNPRDISEALWWIGMHGCKNGLHEACPIADKCNMLISTEPYLKRGILIPNDIGRFKQK